MPSTCYDDASEVVMVLLVWCYCDAFDAIGAVYFNYDASRTASQRNPGIGDLLPCSLAALVLLLW
jgi:hypothetical protein